MEISLRPQLPGRLHSLRPGRRHVGRHRRGAPTSLRCFDAREGQVEPDRSTALLHARSIFDRGPPCLFVEDAFCPGNLLQFFERYSWPVAPANEMPGPQQRQVRLTSERGRVACGDSRFCRFAPSPTVQAKRLTSQKPTLRKISVWPQGAKPVCAPLVPAC